MERTAIPARYVNMPTCTMVKRLKLSLHCGLVLMTALLLARPGHAGVSMEENPRLYSVVIDAGSSGSRVRVYALGTRSSLYQLPNIDEVHNKKQKPGISEFADRLDELPAYLAPLISDAMANIPSWLHGKTPVYLMATAGMRILPEESANGVMDRIDEFLSDKENNPFVYLSINTRILSGEEEGVFAWIAANYLQGSFNADDENELRTSGILELGGASTQVAFIPEGAILADKFPVKIAQTLYPVYVHSYLEYGQQEVVTRIMEYLQSKYPQNIYIEHPCMLKGDVVSQDVSGFDVVFNGTGQPHECLDIINTFVKKEGEFCSPKPCALGQIYQPSVADDQRFYTLGAFYHCINRVGALGPDGNYRLPDVFEKAVTFCQRPFRDVEEENDGKGDFLSTECTMALYLHRLFTYAYGIDEGNEQLFTVRTINEEPIEWTLGAVIYENELQLCGSGPTVGEVKDVATVPASSIFIFVCLLRLLL